MPQEFLWSFRRAGEEKFMKVHSLSSPLPWIVHRGNWKDFRQAFSPLWSYSHGDWADVSVMDLLTGHWTRLQCEG